MSADRYRRKQAWRPCNRIAAAVATNVKLTVMTSSPGPTPAASRARCKRWFRNSRRKQNAPGSTLRSLLQRLQPVVPRINWQLWTTSEIAASISSLMLSYWLFRSTKGIIFSLVTSHCNLYQLATRAQRFFRSFDYPHQSQSGLAIGFRLSYCSQCSQ